MTTPRLTHPGKTFALALFALFFGVTTALAQSTTLFPDLKPGVSLKFCQEAFPTIAKGEAHSKKVDAEAYAIPDTDVATEIRLIFADNELAMLRYIIKDGQLPAVIAAAKTAYGEPDAGASSENLYFMVGTSKLQIAGEKDDQAGVVTFVSPKLMKKFSAGGPPDPPE